MKRLTTLFLTMNLFAAGLGGCASSFSQPTPDGFVKLKHQRSYDYRAVTADGLVYAVKEIRDTSKGNTSFWADAVSNKMRFQAGYALLGTQAVTTESGLQGTQLQFGFDRGKTPHLYNVTLFTKGKTVFVIESGGTKELVDGHKAELDAALKSFRLN